MAAAVGVAGVAVVVSNEVRQTEQHQKVPRPTRTPSAPPTLTPTQRPTDYASRSAFDWAEQVFLEAHSTTNNEHGGFAWGTSYLIQSYLTMAETTGDPTYTDRALAQIEEVLTQRDSVQGQPDYLGRRLPAWGASSPYTAQAALIMEDGNRPALLIQSSATRASGLTLSCHPASQPDEFDIQLMDANRTISANYPALNLDPASPGYAVRVLQRHYSSTSPFVATDLRPPASRLGSSVRAQTSEFASQRYVFAAHTGMITAAIARFARAAKLIDPRLRRYGSRPESILDSALQAIECHEADWQQTNSTAGAYSFPKEAPVPGDGTPLPHNQNLAMARALMAVTDSRAIPEYRRRCGNILQVFRDDWSDSSAPTWPYFWSQSPSYKGYSVASGISHLTPASPPNRAFEDTSHATIDVAAAVEAADRGLIFGRTDLARLARTFLIRVRTRTSVGGLTNNNFGAASKSGTFDDIAPLWAVLSPWNHEVYAYCVKILDELAPMPNHAYVLSGIALLTSLG